MNGRIFVYEINKLYEKVYSINENLSSEQSVEFMAGFNDTIKEGISILEANFMSSAGKALGTAWKGAKDVASDVTQKAKGYGQEIAKFFGDAYQKGVELAKKVIRTVADFTKMLYEKVSSAFTQAYNFVITAPDKVYNYLKGVYEEVVGYMKHAWDVFKGKSQELLDAVTKFWNEKIVAEIKNGVEKIKQEVIKDEQKLKTWYETNKEYIKKKIQEYKASSIEFIKNLAIKAENILVQIGKGALEGGKVIAILLFVGPIVALVEGIKRIPELYEATKNIVQEGLNKVEQTVNQAIGAVKQGVEEFKAGVKQGAEEFKSGFKQGAHGFSGRQINFTKDDTKALLAKLKNPNYVDYKDEISTILNKRGVAIPATESRRIKSFGSFLENSNSEE